jgi:coproporphyrinogen III oxidase
MEMNNYREHWINIVHGLQDQICTALEVADGRAKFLEDQWERSGGGGGKTRVLTGGDVFEKAGVNTSVVHGAVTEQMKIQLKMIADNWFACGISLVIHPNNPFVPTVHCNYRMIELQNDAGETTDLWFGGGTDLTPYYLYEDDAVHFHQTYKNVCDSFDRSFYYEFKQLCDNYFVNTHRDNERRGIGGIFYDHQRPSLNHDLSFWMNFGKACGEAFTVAYLPIVERRKDNQFSSEHKYWQEIRRGRYTEFNLVHDRGTIFGLKTNGRTESILMSLPPTVRFDYNHQPASGSEEARLLEVCLHPRQWVF